MLENAIVKAVEAGAKSEKNSSAPSIPGRGEECLQLLVNYGQSVSQSVSPIRMRLGEENMLGFCQTALLKKIALTVYWQQMYDRRRVVKTPIVYC